MHLHLMRAQLVQALLARGRRAEPAPAGNVEGCVPCVLCVPCVGCGGDCDCRSPSRWIMVEVVVWQVRCRQVRLQWQVRLV